MKPLPAPTKKMELGVHAEIAKTIQAVKDVAQNSGIPKQIFPDTTDDTHARITDHGAAPPPMDAESATVSSVPNITSLPPQSQTQQRKARGPKPAPVKRTSVDLPLYLIDQIRTLSFNTNRTKRRVILEALRAGGLTVKDIDLDESQPDV